MKRPHEVVQVSAEPDVGDEHAAQNDLPPSQVDRSEEEELAASTRTSVYRGRRGSVSTQAAPHLTASMQACRSRAFARHTGERRGEELLS